MDHDSGAALRRRVDAIADTNLKAILRRALGRARIVEGYEHRCRKPGCGHLELATEAANRRCPKDGRALCRTFASSMSSAFDTRTSLAFLRFDRCCQRCRCGLGEEEEAIGPRRKRDKAVRLVESPPALILG